MIRQEANQDIVRLIAQWNVRLRLQHTLTWLPRGLSAGLGAAVGVALLARYRPILLQQQVLAVGLALAAAGALVALAAVWVWPQPTAHAARHYDRLFGLKERLSTALELSAGRLRAVRGDIAALQVDDALTAARRVDHRSQMPFQVRWRDWVTAAVLLAAFLVAWWLPNPQAGALAVQQAFSQTVEAQVSDLRALRENALADSSLTEEEREAILQTLDDAIETLEQPGVTREEAVATLSEASQKLRDLSAAETEAVERRVAALREAVAPIMTEDAATIGLAQALQSGDMQRAAEAMQQLAEGLGQMSQEQREALAQQLERAAEALEAAAPEMAQQLREAAEALREGDTERAQAALQELAEQMRQLGAQSQQRAPGSQTMERMAEQVQEGQQRLMQMWPAGRTQSDAAGPSAQQEQSGAGVQQGAEDQGAALDGGMADGADEGEGQEQGGGSRPGEGDQPGLQEGEERSGASRADMESQLEGGRGAGQGEGAFGENPGAAGEADAPSDHVNRPGGRGLREYEAVLAPSRIGGQGADEMGLPIYPQDLEEVPWREGAFTQPRDAQSFVPYNQVFREYADAANDALESGRIPLGLRGVIREYFTSLEP